MLGRADLAVDGHGFGEELAGLLAVARGIVANPLSGEANKRAALPLVIHASSPVCRGALALHYHYRPRTGLAAEAAWAQRSERFQERGYTVDETAFDRPYLGSGI